MLLSNSAGPRGWRRQDRKCGIALRLRLFVLSWVPVAYAGPCASRAGNDCGNAILDANDPNNAYVESIICDSDQHREPYVGPTRNDGWVCGQN